MSGDASFSLSEGGGGGSDFAGSVMLLTKNWKKASRIFATRSSATSSSKSTLMICFSTRKLYSLRSSLYEYEYVGELLMVTPRKLVVVRPVGVREYSADSCLKSRSRRLQSIVTCPRAAGISVWYV